MNEFNIVDLELYEKVSDAIADKSGIYVLKCRSTSGGYAHIGRLLGEDREGILYIGSSQVLRNRCGLLKIACCAAAGVQGYTNLNAHQCGHKYKPINIRDNYPVENLCISIFLKENYRQSEIDALNDYEERFGELPPFNDGRPQRKSLCTPENAR